jgi:hypothetical protein
VPLSALKRATIETLGITPRRDGKVEIVLRVLADHERLTDCAAKFIKAGVESFKLTDVFKAIAPAWDQDDFGLSAEPPRIGPDVLPFDRQSSVRVPGPIDVSDACGCHAEGTGANDNGVTQPRHAACLGELSIHDLATLLGLLETLRQEVAAIRFDMEQNREQHYLPVLQRLLEKAS